MIGRQRPTRGSATALLVVVFVVLIALVWYGRDQPGPIAQIQAEILCAFLGLTALLLVSLPAAMALSPTQRPRWRQTLGVVPIGVAVGVAAGLYIRASTAELGRTLLIAAGVAVPLSIAALASFLRTGR